MSFTILILFSAAAAIMEYDENENEKNDGNNVVHALKTSIHG